MDPRIPVMRPRLPRRDALVPYLDVIDQARWYSNNGPLLMELQARLARRYGGGDAVACASSGTSALALALMAQEPARGGLCLAPSFTFAATIHAIVLAGLRPYFLDVSMHDWALSATECAEAIAWLRSQGEEVVACTPVAPFGAPLDPAPWSALRAETGVAVAIDAAAAFSTVVLSDVPAAVSLHAIKSPGVGEGGFVLWADEDRIAYLRRLTNFSFGDDRVAVAAAMNAKMSEYHAAVGHAALDEWPSRSKRATHLAALCRAALASSSDVALQLGWGESWRSSTWNVVAPGDASGFIERLDAEYNIEARRWWATPCHAMPAWADAGHAPAPNTERLARTVFGLPFHEDLTPEDVARIAEAVRRCAEDLAPPDADSADAAGAAAAG